jgi:NAD(P)-dependent dehydrogenase (short-subunit alcohol dehydrogenase family)
MSRGIRVNVVSPGSTDTPGFNDLLASSAVGAERRNHRRSWRPIMGKRQHAPRRNLSVHSVRPPGQRIVMPGPGSSHSGAADADLSWSAILRSTFAVGIGFRCQAACARGGITCTNGDQRPIKPAQPPMIMILKILAAAEPLWTGRDRIVHRAWSTK